MQEVAILGNSPVSEIEENAFFGAVNRAFERASKIRPQTKIMHINNYSLPAVEISRLAKEITSQKAIEITGENVSAIYINTSGTCTVVIYCNGAKVKTIHASAQDLEHRLVVYNLCGKDSANVKIVLSANYAKLISYALWRDRYSNNEADVPDTSIYNTYRLDRIASDFHSLVRISRIDTGGEQELDLTQYILSNNKELWLLRNHNERVKLEYQTKRKPITRDNIDVDIDVDEDIAQLIILLTAYWVWYEDLNEIAQNCYAQYMQRAAEIKTEARAPANPAPKNVYGW